MFMHFGDMNLDYLCLGQKKSFPTVYNMPRPRKKIFVFHVTRPTHVKDPRTKKVFLTFWQKLVFGRVFHKINCFALFSVYSGTARSYSISDCSITCKFVKKNTTVKLELISQIIYTDYSLCH